MGVRIKLKTVCIQLLFTAYMVRTGLNILCLQSNKLCIYTVSIVIYITVYTSNLTILHLQGKLSFTSF